MGNRGQGQAIDTFCPVLLGRRIAELVAGVFVRFRRMTSARRGYNPPLRALACVTQWVIQLRNIVGVSHEEGRRMNRLS